MRVDRRLPVSRPGRRRRDDPRRRSRMIEGGQSAEAEAQEPEEALDATRQARRGPLLEELAENGDERRRESPRRRPGARRCSGPGTDLKALIFPTAPKYTWRPTSRTRPRIRDRPVASEKIAVDLASRRPGCSSTGAYSRAAAPALPATFGPIPPARASVSAPCRTSATEEAPSHRQQPAAENLRFSRRSKTLQRRLKAAVESRRRDPIAAEHRELVRWIDRAGHKAAIHKNAAAPQEVAGRPLVSSGSPSSSRRDGAASRER